MNQSNILEIFRSCDECAGVGGQGRVIKYRWMWAEKVESSVLRRNSWNGYRMQADMESERVNVGPGSSGGGRGFLKERYPSLEKLLLRK